MRIFIGGPETRDLTHTIPGSLTPFVGRAADCAQLLTLLRTPTCRLVSIIGPVGVGKTRLALEAARILRGASAGRFSDGIFAVSLAALTLQHPMDDLFATTIGSVVGLPFSGTDPPVVQLQRYLRSKGLLPVLDNFEHIAPAPAFLTRLLRDAPQLAIVVTSRKALGLQDEWHLPLSGLPCPPQAEHAWKEANEDWSACDLFVQLAPMYAPAWALTPTNALDVARICRLVDGLPLGIELAVSWLAVLSCSEIADELARNLDLLTTNASDPPPRQQSLHALFDSSWDLLNEAERRALRRLAIFRGSFTRDAATTIADVSLPLHSQGAGRHVS